MDDRSRLEISPGIWLDARRAVFLADTGTLAVADLHLGYAWAQRARGNLLPVGNDDDTLPRLRALIEDYAPREVALLGDIVHAALDLAPLKAELHALLALAAQTQLRLLIGNHDAGLAALLAQSGVSLELHRVWRAGPHLLLHGDEPDELRALAQLASARERRGKLILGHEHPAIDLSDGVAARMRCPAFLAGNDALVLPAFSNWAAGGDANSGRFLSPCARAATFDRAVVIVAGKLLPIDFAARQPPPGRPASR